MPSRRIPLTCSAEITWTSSCSFRGRGSQRVRACRLTPLCLFACHRPAFHLRCGSKPSIAVRCSPVLYKLRDTGLKAATSEHNTGSLSESDAKKSTVGLLRAPFRMLFAVATLDSVLVYDTQQLHPICCLKNLHYEKLTDIAWCGKHVCYLWCCS